MILRNLLPRRRLLLMTALLATCPISDSAAASAFGGRDGFDVVILNGRVIDPETRFDAVANVGIKDGIITEITPRALRGRYVIDARDLVVVPGFIDLHSHGQNEVGQRQQALDGVTTALEQEIGAYPIAAFLAAREGRARINFGASAGHQAIRSRVTGGTGDGPGDAAAANRDALLDAKAKAPLTEAELDRTLAILRREIGGGALGVGLAPEYIPGADRREIYQVMKAAAEEGVPVFTHVRAARTPGPGGLFEMIQEMIANTAATGGALHICHVTSKGLGDTGLILEAIAGARRNGMDISTEAYPYTAGSTLIGSALFDDGWRERWNADYGDLEWPATGERLTEQTFRAYRRAQPGAYVIFHMIPQEAMIAAIRHPLVMIASDAVDLSDGHGHPRGSGSFARVLGHHVRERHDLSLMEALRKMTLMPAQRMDFVPAMRRKGRMRVGMDADITIFDPRTVIDRATYREPLLPSRGMIHVLVGGTPVVRDAAIVEGVFPGKAVRHLSAPSADRE